MKSDNIFSSHIKRKKLAAFVYSTLFIISFLIINSNKKNNEIFIIILIVIFLCFPLRQIFKVFKLKKFKKNFDNKVLDKNNINVVFDGKDYTLTDEYIIDYKSMNVLFYKNINKINKRNSVTDIFTKHPKSVEKIDIYMNSNNEKYVLISKIYNKPNISKQYYENLYDYLKLKSSIH